MSTPGGGPGPERCDVLVVGAGPTGLTLALQLAAAGVACRVVDAAADRVHQSRALALQPRSLEVLAPLGVAGELVRLGNPGVRLHVHARGRTTSAPLFDTGLDDTAFPFLLFLSQARTEEVLLERLAGAGVQVRRRTRLEELHDDGEHVTCRLRRPDGSIGVVLARYVVGCDGARSTVRQAMGVPFTGGRYPQTFLLADLAVDGLAPGAVHAYVGPAGPLLFFPLQQPAPWRLITARPTTGRAGGPEQAPPGGDPSGGGPVALAELNAAVAAATHEPLHLHEPVWSSAFGIPHRQAGAYRAGRLFVAGDAAHVHSPAGAQGMNTGIQDAVDLGWKLALVLRGDAREELLDTYDDERRPVGAFVVRMSDRAFSAATSARAPARLARGLLAPRLLPLVLRSRRARATAFRTVSQLGITYRRSSATAPAAGSRRPGPGDRLPDLPVVRAGVAGRLHEALTAPVFHLLLCGPPGTWDGPALERWRRSSPVPVRVHHLQRRAAAGAEDDVLVDPTGRTLARLRVRTCAVLLVRPDTHVATRTDGADLTAAAGHLAGLAAGAPAR
ncbi:monooxygenase [Kineococcus sp. T13]|uniref:FAD-dependent monooxygenase n=1 Tax=Kineococcus vitellinus TaxID=2696565 RepID=UPI0014125FBA|nr:monooxygenase [Kineococcus vitellinus]